MFRFEARPDTVFLDPNNGVISDTTTIVYDFNDRPLVMFQRYIGTSADPGIPQSWKKVDLVAKSRARTAKQAQIAEQSGSFESDPIIAGQLLQYAVAEEFAPVALSDHGRGSQPAIITIAGLLRDSGNQDWITDQGSLVGGTFFLRKIATGSERTFLKLQVGLNKPEYEAYGVPFFDKPVATLANPFAAFHDVEAVPLAPGNSYFAVVRLSDAKGRWQVLPIEQFTTLQRKVSLEFPKLHVQNDGDPMNSSQAEFNIAVKEDDSDVARFKYNNEDVDDTKPDKRNFDLPAEFHCVIGPKRVPPRGLPVTIEVWGTEFDGFLESDEKAWNADSNIKFPVGFAREKVSDETQVLGASPAPGDNFAFTVTMKFSVEYI
ncbi:hypothetical protein [Methylocystis suflitae]|uniref:hypothetical protein n=1 Tax=Methylocystis suflitae TaxID=2951405 RepID=UPI00210BEA28|nr:hypothetical protein [Methylocystis suflitae]MCQ4191297.1 hypothetical protein [Methylocystis suflitae]